jgi:hypothetical protein
MFRGQRVEKFGRGLRRSGWAGNASEEEGAGKQGAGERGINGARLQ